MEKRVENQVATVFSGSIRVLVVGLGYIVYRRGRALGREAP